MNESNQTISIPMEYFTEKLLKSGKLPDDFTFYLSHESVKSFFSEQGLKLNKTNKIEPTRLTVDLCSQQGIEGRALFCLSYGDRLWSITFRLLSKSAVKGKIKGKKSQKIAWETNFTPDSKRGKNLNSLREVCDSIRTKLFSSHDQTKKDFHGLILITGATASAKSQITHGLIDYYLKTSVQPGKRRPHLVTFEDPIEKYFLDYPSDDLPPPAASNEAVVIPSHSYNIDYTPREKGKGVSKLSQALEDALRQTPKIFFVGETRLKDDWKDLMSFAGSGHLVITTAHAGSLTESMQLIFKSNDVSSASERNHFANRILGVIHLKRLEIDQINVLLPSMWLGRPRSISNITAMGLTSLLPGSDPEAGSPLGRSYFAEELFETARKNSKKSLEKSSLKMLNKTEQDLLKRKIIKKAMETDLKGE